MSDLREKPLGPAVPTPAAIEAVGLRKSFGSTCAVDNLDLRVQEGEIFGLVGPDGAGKTTTFRLLMGLLRPDAGRVWIGPYEMPAEAREARAVVGYVAQQFALYWDLSVMENIRFQAEVRGLDPKRYATRLEWLLDLTGLTPYTERLARDLSGGMRRKLSLLAALLPRPRTLLLDEPTTGVDPVSRREFWRMLYGLPAEGVTLLVSTPYLDEAERCHRLGFMANGDVKAVDTPIGLLARMEDSVVEIRTSARSTAWKLLKAQPEVRWVDTSGGGLRVAFDPDAPGLEEGCALGKRLEAAGIPVRECTPVGATLSDAFTSLTEASGGSG